MQDRVSSDSQDRRMGMEKEKRRERGFLKAQAGEADGEVFWRYAKQGLSPGQSAAARQRRICADISRSLFLSTYYYFFLLEYFKFQLFCVTVVFIFLFFYICINTSINIKHLSISSHLSPITTVLEYLAAGTTGTIITTHSFFLQVHSQCQLDYRSTEDITNIHVYISTEYINNIRTLYKL